VTDADRRSALVVVAAEAEPVVGEWRRRYLRESVERGIPPHLTILFPFLPAPEIDTGVLAELGRLFAPVPPFAYELASVESFPDAAWLAPVPAEPFHGLVGIARGAFPAFPPYGDPEHVVVPHCTIGTDEDPAGAAAMVRELRERLGPRLPIRCRADEVVLVGEQANGTWVRHGVFPLRGAA
jgi:2'-5' RNA ligase